MSSSRVSYIVTVVLVLLVIRSRCDLPPNSTDTDSDFQPSEDTYTPSHDRIEGDIAVASGDSDGVFRSAVNDRRRLWPGGVIPYRIDSSVGSRTRTLVREAVALFNRYTCIRWQERSNSFYVRIFSGNGCWSYVGYQRLFMNGRRWQDMSIQRGGCESFRTVQHEMMHAIGVYHQQSRTDRDRCVRILTNNIIPRTLRNFRIENNSDTLRVPYDYRSVMHYSQYAFSIRPGLVTIRTLDSRFQNIIGRGASMTPRDVDIINIRYGCRARSCPKRCPSSSSTTVVYQAFDDCSCWCVPRNGYLNQARRCQVIPPPTDLIENGSGRGIVFRRISPWRSSYYRDTTSNGIKYNRRVLTASLTCSQSSGLRELQTRDLTQANGNGLYCIRFTYGGSGSIRFEIRPIGTGGFRPGNRRYRVTTSSGGSRLRNAAVTYFWREGSRLRFQFRASCQRVCLLPVRKCTGSGRSRRCKTIGCRLWRHPRSRIYARLDNIRISRGAC